MGYVRLWESPLQPDLDDPTGPVWVPSGFNRPSRLAEPIFTGTRCKLVIAPMTKQNLLRVDAWVKVDGELYPQALKEPTWTSDGYETEFVIKNDFGYDEITAFKLVVFCQDGSRSRQNPKAKLMIDEGEDD